MSFNDGFNTTIGVIAAVGFVIVLIGLLPFIVKFIKFVWRFSFYFVSAHPIWAVFIIIFGLAFFMTLGIRGCRYE